MGLGGLEVFVVLLGLEGLGFGELCEDEVVGGVVGGVVVGDVVGVVLGVD